MYWKDTFINALGFAFGAIVLYFISPLSVEQIFNTWLCFVMGNVWVRFSDYKGYRIE